MTEYEFIEDYSVRGPESFSVFAARDPRGSATGEIRQNLPNRAIVQPKTYDFTIRPRDIDGNTDPFFWTLVAALAVFLAGAAAFAVLAFLSFHSDYKRGLDYSGCAAVLFIFAGLFGSLVLTGLKK